MQGAFSSYQQSMSDKITSSSPEELIVMLYDGMVSKIRQAKERFEAGQEVRAKESVIKAMKIADALMENLNFEEGGETAKNLEKLYYFVIHELAEANRANQPQPKLENALRVIEPLHEGWKALAKH